MSDQIIFKPRTAGSFNVSNFPGVQPVSDASADASLSSIAGAITATPAKMQIGVTGEGGKNYPYWIGNLTAATQITSGTVTILTATAGYYITSITISIDPRSTLAAASTLLLEFFDSVASGDIVAWAIYMPAAAASPTLPTIINMSTPPGFFWNNKNSGSALKVKTNIALTGGSITVSVNYGLTTIVN